jgi:CTP synthase (UTP-ammonia lyase)
MEDAEHEESAPNASSLLISKLSCSLVGITQRIKIRPGTLVHQVYQQEEVTEEFRCNYGLNPRYHDKISNSRFKIAGIDGDGEVRIVELAEHRFFVATLFLPQLSSTIERPHPIIIAYLKAAQAFRTLQSRSEIKL